MTKNPILDELHAVREQLLADAGETLDALVDRIQADEQRSNRPHFKSRRTIRGTGAAKPGGVEADDLSPPPGDL